MAGNNLIARKFGKNSFGKLLAKFNTPLIKAINAPDNALGKDLMFVHSHQGTEGSGGKLLQEERVGRFVALKHFLWHKLFKFFL